MLEIPLTNDPYQKFSVFIDDTRYDCELSFNDRMEAWTMNVSSNGEELIHGLPLLSGVNIVDQFLFFEDNVFVLNINDDTQNPTFEDIGEESKLLIVTQEEING